MNVFSATLRQKSLWCVGLFAIGWTSLAWAGGKDDVQAAMEKAYLAKNYTWALKTSDEPEIHAKTQPRGYTSAVASFDGKSRTIVIEGFKEAVLTDTGWKLASDLGFSGPQAKFAAWLDAFEREPLLEITSTLHDVPTLTATTGGQYSGSITEDGVVTALTDFGKQTKVTDAHGTLTITLKDGLLTRGEIHLTGTVTSSEGSKAVDRQQVFSFSDYNLTTPDVPDAAKQALVK